MTSDKKNQLMEDAYHQIKGYKQTVDAGPHRLHYHLMPPVGLLNDPNGLIYFQNNYHVFFQWNPFETAHGAKFWGHYMSADMVNWEFAPIALAPDKWYDKNGCYSGSAIVHHDRLYLFYTGNVKDEQDNRESYQCLAVSDDGITFEKKGPIINVPEGYTAHFRDPKVFQHGNDWYMVLGAQTKTKQGQVVLYRSEDLETWTFLGPIAGSKLNGLGDFGYMWECPDLFQLDGKDILVASPQGLEPQGMNFQNIYQAGYFAGEIDLQTQKFTHDSFVELDRGFDFYAPQTFTAGERRILIGWMGNAEEEGPPQPTVNHNWIHTLTIPRELRWKRNALYQTPIKELEALRENEVSHQQLKLTNQSIELPNVNGNVFEIEVAISEWNANRFTIRIGKSVLTYDDTNSVLTYERMGRDGQLESRACELEQLNHIRIFKDTSSIEIFANHGQEVFSSRQFDDWQDKRIVFQTDGIHIMDVTKWDLKPFMVADKSV
ncbi:glycoside hydrolase family 32 protein [Aquibacillus sediminis]|uniref:glycoside hydrolase family 32 protein n=1 Tax=Aquibacillus sediminis TaxID=2574734 RepID=UPI001109BE54|nr:sucrose-6-phosphate hydrolase [Aquibacillus sediminis]